MVDGEGNKIKGGLSRESAIDLAKSQPDYKFSSEQPFDTNFERSI